MLTQKQGYVMTKGMQHNLFSYLSYLFFEEISPKFRADALKPFMDVMYIFFEKICFHFDTIIDMYLDMYEELIDNEIHLARITKKDQILLIGCGAIPASSILFVQKTGASLVGIDIDKKAVQRANQVAKKLHLYDKLTFKLEKEMNTPFSKYSHIIIVYGLKHETALFSHLASHINNDAKIIYRISQSKYERTPIEQQSNLSEFLVLEKTCTPSMGNTISLLLKRKESTIH